MTLNRLAEICAEGIGIDLQVADRKVRDELHELALKLTLARWPVQYSWPNPAAIEQEIEAIISDARALRRRVSNLNGYALSLARKHADRETIVEAERRVSEADDRDLLAAVDDLLKVHAGSSEAWIDKATIAHLDRLIDALQRPAELAIRSQRPGSRRPRNEAVYGVTLQAARAYCKLAGRVPGKSGSGNTRFWNMLRQVLEDLGLPTADLRRPTEEALRILRENGEFAHLDIS